MNNVNKILKETIISEDSKATYVRQFQRKKNNYNNQYKMQSLTSCLNPSKPAKFLTWPKGPSDPWTIEMTIEPLGFPFYLDLNMVGTQHGHVEENTTLACILMYSSFLYSFIANTNNTFNIVYWSIQLSVFKRFSGRVYLILIDDLILYVQIYRIISVVADIIMRILKLDIALYILKTWFLWIIVTHRCPQLLLNHNVQHMK